MFPSFDSKTLARCILAIDVGPEKSGFALYNKEIKEIEFASHISNIHLRTRDTTFDFVIIEYPDFVSKGAGNSIINTAFEAGRFFQFYKTKSIVTIIGRSKVKAELGCINDSEIRKYIINKRGKEFCKKLTSHAWQAFSLIEYWESVSN